MTVHDEISDLEQLGAALATIGQLARKPELTKQLGASFCAELTGAAVAFRQRFPEHWPGAQKDLFLSVQLPTDRDADRSGK